jgi:DNA-directed RNA polymerase specialized sigma24 family protein
MNPAQADKRNPGMTMLGVFPQWLQRLQEGDREAAAEFVNLIEPRLLQSVRARLAHFHLGRVIDPRDICQSVFGTFFSRAASTGFTIGSVEQLRALLVRMARNRVHDEARRHLAGRRDCRRIVRNVPPEQLSHLEGAEPTPSKIAAGHELLEEIRRLFTEEEHRLLEERSRGRDWADISLEWGVRPEALRKKLNRAIQRVLRQLHLDDA